jgi:uncharacterized protein (DUF302 family)
MSPFFIVHTDQSFESACTNLEAAVLAEGYSILAVHDLGHSLRSKGIDFPENCRVFEVCNPQQAAKVLKLDMALCMALPCRIAVYTEAGRARIGMIRPADQLSRLSPNPELIDGGQQVEEATRAMILAAASSGQD